MFILVVVLVILVFAPAAPAAAAVSSRRNTAKEIAQSGFHRIYFVVDVVVEELG